MTDVIPCERSEPGLFVHGCALNCAWKPAERLSSFLKNSFAVHRLANYIYHYMRHFLLVILFFLVRCQEKEIDPELLVINSTFLEIVGTYNAPPKPPPPSPVYPDSLLPETDLDSIDYVGSEPRRGDRDIVLRVNDTLISPHFVLSEFFENGVIPERFKAHFDLDDSWRGLVMQLLQQNLEAKSFDPNNLTNAGEYIIKGSDFLPTDEDWVAAELTFSRVIFNKNGDRACYYYQEHCGLLCGYGYLVFVERLDGRWKIKSTLQLWIS